MQVSEHSLYLDKSIDQDRHRAFTGRLREDLSV